MTLAPSDRRGGLATAGDGRPGGGRSHAREVRVFEARSAARSAGLLAIAASGLYFLSDVIEAIQGRFSDGQLWLTLVAEAAIPIFVVGLAVAPRPRLGRLGMLAAAAYAYSFVYFTGTVVYALVNSTKDYDTLTHDLGAVMTAHGAVMVIAGLGFGYAVLRVRLLPAWTAVAVMAGVVLVALTQGTPESVQLVAAGVRDLGFAGMGAAVLARGGDGDATR